MSGLTGISHAHMRVRPITFGHPRRWLEAGWQDIARAPAVSLGYGLLFAVAGFLVVFGLDRLRMGGMALPMALGFALLGPAAAVGFYESSRRLAAGEPVPLAVALAGFRRNAGQLAVVGVFLALAFLAWLRLAALEYDLFFGPAPASLAAVIESMAGSDVTLAFLAVGTLTGGVLALLVFSMTVVAVPMLVDGKVDAVSAMSASLDAVRSNAGPMALWALLIAGFTFAGLALLFVGLAVTLPLIGHASWHAYRDLVAQGPRLRGSKPPGGGAM